MIGEALVGDTMPQELRRVLRRAEAVVRKHDAERDLVAEWEHLMLVAASTNVHIGAADSFRASANAVARRCALNEIELAVRDIASGRAVDLPALVDRFDAAFLRFAHLDVEQRGSKFSTLSTELAKTAYKSRFCTPSILPDAELPPMSATYETSLSDGPVDRVCSKIAKRLEKVHAADLAFPFVDGSTGAIRVIAGWIASSQRGQACVGVNRIAHKSVIHALYVAGVDWYYLDEPTPDARFDALAPIDPAGLAAALDPRTTHVWVNSVTYEGVIAPIREIARELDRWAEAGRRRRRPVLVADEAWGAHLRFDPQLRRHRALECGADIVTFSTHKAGGARQGTAVLTARRSDRFDLDGLAAVVRGTMTTSPNFPHVASLEAATNILYSKQGKHRIAVSRRLAEKLALELRASGLAVSSSDGGDLRDSPVAKGLELDPLKVNIQLTGRRSGFKISRTLERAHGVVVEKHGFCSLLFLIPFQIDDVDVAIAATAAAKIMGGRLRASSRLGAADPPVFPRSPAKDPDAPSGPELEKRAVGLPLDVGLRGCISVDVAAAYPPGVPVIAPGDRITDAQVAYLVAVHRGGGHVATVGDVDGAREPLVRAIPKRKAGR